MNNHSQIERERAIAFQNAKNKAKDEINVCFYPDCNEKSINSHILQKNGILSYLEENGHVMQMGMNLFSTDIHCFKKIGINKAFSFDCFCTHHDSELFKTIETREIDFSAYRNNLLFTLRTKYNEKFRKMVNVRMWDILIEKHSDLFDIAELKGINVQEKLGISDIEKTEKLIWNDLNENQESFVFFMREINKIPLCLSAFYNYETTQELKEYYRINGKNKENVSDIFINVFPYLGKTIFMMGYKKKDEKTVKQYVNSFFKESENRLLSKLTNLMLFQCETWITSESFYLERIKKCETNFDFAARFSYNNENERVFFNLNLFKESFCYDFNQWKNRLFNLL
jgi:hypothetical protein